VRFIPSETGVVGIGGCIGSIARYQVNEWIPSLFGTFVVNIVGCFAIGILMYESIYFGAFSRHTRLLFGAGMSGSFTTFSAFATQSFQEGFVIGGIFVFANITCGLFGVLFGRYFILGVRSTWNI